MARCIKGQAVVALLALLVVLIEELLNVPGARSLMHGVPGSALTLLKYKNRVMYLPTASRIIVREGASPDHLVHEFVSAEYFLEQATQIMRYSRAYMQIERPVGV